MAPSTRKNIAYIGLGKIGFNMVSRLLTKKYRVSVYDTDKQAMRRIKKLGGNPVSSLQKLTEVTKSPRLLWIMVPQGVVASVPVVSEIPGREISWMNKYLYAIEITIMKYLILQTLD